MIITALIKPDTDLDGAFKAFDLEERELIKVNGWLASSIEDLVEYQPMASAILTAGPL